MQILDRAGRGLRGSSFGRAGGQSGCPVGVLFVLIVALGAGCSRNPGMSSVETDAHGYYCRHCQAKLFTGSRVFLENCPKCRENALVDVVGYWCETDQHLTLRLRTTGPEGASVCEKCGRRLTNAMVSPREKDLLAWGATKTTPPQTPSASN